MTHTRNERKDDAVDKMVPLWLKEPDGRWVLYNNCKITGMGFNPFLHRGNFFNKTCHSGRFWKKFLKPQLALFYKTCHSGRFWKTRSSSKNSMKPAAVAGFGPTLKKI